jgi:hypothetical protein
VPAHLLLDGEQFKNMSVGVAKVHAPSAAAVVDFHIVSRVRLRPIGDAFRLNAAKDRVELRLIDLECVVMGVEPVGIVEIVSKIEGERLIHAQGREIPNRAFIEGSPKILVKNFAASILSRAGTMV